MSKTGTKDLEPTAKRCARQTSNVETAFKLAVGSDHRRRLYVRGFFSGMQNCLTLAKLQ